MATRKNTYPRVKARRERAIARLEKALAPDSGHEFGTDKRFGYWLDGIPDDVMDRCEADARAEAERCLANLREKVGRPVPT